MTREAGKWNGRPAVILRRGTPNGVPHVTIQVEEVAQLGRGKSYERIYTVPLATWRAAQANTPRKEKP